MTHRHSARLATCATVLIAAVANCATSRHARTGLATTEPTTIVPAERTGDVPIHERIARAVSNHCVYTLTADGIVREAGPTPDGTRYDPRLRIEAELQCSDEPPERRVTLFVAERPVRRADLEWAIKRSTRLVHATAGGRCEYVPDFDFAGAGLIGRNVRESCVDARGGGPRAPDDLDDAAPRAPAP
jgi:hypothetical protein